MSKPPLLFLCHRIPYPPNKGDKIRSFHLLHHLSRHFEIYLGSFVDDPKDWPWVTELEKFCAGKCLRPLRPWQATIRSLKGLFDGQALSVPYYTDRTLQRWVADTIAEKNIRHAIVYSSAMAQFLPDEGAGLERKVIDFVDVDSDKWEQYAEQKSQPMRWVYKREARCLLQLEQELARRFDAGLFVSSSEAALFRKLSPETSSKVGYYNNGVNSEYFDPDFEEGECTQNPYQPGSQSLVFTGAMDYWPNVDAVTWFASHVMPILRRDHPELQFYIVGGNPARAVQKLQHQAGITVTGRVPDVRPYLKYALAAVAPMRVARGVQNKVLEGMAMARPVLVSPRGLEGIDARHEGEILLADSVGDYACLLEKLLAGEYESLGEKARNHVQSEFNWDNNLPEVVFLLGRGKDSTEPAWSMTHG